MPRVSFGKAKKVKSKKIYRPELDYGSRGYEVDKEVVPFGGVKVTLYRRSDIAASGWFFRLHVKDERRNYRKSLKTTSLAEAKERLPGEVIAILARLQTGQRLLSIRLKDLLRRYRLHLQEQVTNGQITANTERLNHYRLLHGAKFLSEKLVAGMDTQLSALQGSVFNEYLEWRQAKKLTIRRDVVRDELLSIRKMFLFAKRERLCTDSAVPLWDFIVEKEGPKRQRMTQKNYTDVVNLMRGWVAEANSERHSYHRRLLQHIFLLIANSGMRSGEVFGLKNQDIEVRRNALECVVTIRAETSKVKKSRRIVVGPSHGGRARDTQPINYLIRWIDQYQRHKDPANYLFAPFTPTKKGSGSAREVYYKEYQEFRMKLKEVGLDWFDTYHCRHFWITNRLLAEEPIHIVAKAAGTSTSEIEKTYSHVLTEMSTRQFGKKRLVYDSEGGYEVHAEAKPKK